MDEMEDSLEAVTEEVRRLERLVNDLLDLTRLEAHQFRVVSEEVGLEALLEQAAASFREKARANDIEFDTTTAAAPTVMSDGDRVLQIVTNLLDNAFRWTPRGGMVKLACVTSSGIAAITISDSGPGIAPGDLNRSSTRSTAAAGRAAPASASPSHVSSHRLWEAVWRSTASWARGRPSPSRCPATGAAGGVDGLTLRDRAVARRACGRVRPRCPARRLSEPPGGVGADRGLGRRRRPLRPRHAGARPGHGRPRPRGDGGGTARRRPAGRHPDLAGAPSAARHSLDRPLHDRCRGTTPGYGREAMAGLLAHKVNEGWTEAGIAAVDDRCAGFLQACGFGETGTTRHRFAGGEREVRLFVRQLEAAGGAGEDRGQRTRRRARSVGAPPRPSAARPPRRRPARPEPPARSDSRRRRSRWPEMRSTGSRGRPPPRPPACNRSASSSGSPAPPPRHTGPTAWTT